MSTTTDPQPTTEYVQRTSPTVAVAISEQRIRGEAKKSGEPKASTNT
jgi:hypothetical protein